MHTLNKKDRVLGAICSRTPSSFRWLLKGFGFVVLNVLEDPQTMERLNNDKQK
jgi:hypothetical protein